MASLSINEMTTFRWSFDEDVARYQAAGINAIGVWRQKLADYGEDKGIALLSRSGLKVSNLLWAGGFTGSCGQSHDEALIDAQDALRLAHALETSNLVVYSGARNGHTQNHARRLFTVALEKLLPLAEELHVVLAIEPMHTGCADEWTFLTDLDETIDLIRGFGSPNLKLAFDTYHLGHEPNVAAKIGDIVAEIGIVHLGDGAAPPEREQNRRCLGDGSLPLGCIVKALQQAGYRGYYDVELIGEEIENCSYSELLEGSKRAFAAWLN